MHVLLTLLALSIIAFLIAFVFRNKKLNETIYDAITCLGATIILGVIVFDFIPHLFNDFPFNSQEIDLHHGHDHSHHGHHHEKSNFTWSGSSLFSLLIIVGFFLQLGLEKWVIKKHNHILSDWILVIGLFLHSFSEVALLHDQSNQLNQSLFLGILCHKLPVAFILAYTLLKDVSIKKALMGYGVFMLSIPLGLLFNDFMSNSGVIFNLISVLITGMILHVIWHMIEAIKTKKVINWIMIFIGLAIGYSLTLFHVH